MAVTATEPTSRAERARQTREAILAIALKLFAERGYDATSLQDIADEMGLTKAAVYYHYNAKLELLHAICEPVEKAMTAVIDRAAQLRTRRQKIDAMVNGFANIMIEKRAVMRVLANDPVMNGQMKLIKVDALFDRAVRVLYGDDPTPDQMLAVHAVTGLGDAIAALPDLSDDEVRTVLVRTLKRLVPER